MDMILKSYNTKYKGLRFNLEFKDRLTLIHGDSGVGKTLLFKAILNRAILDDNRDIICLSYTDYLSRNIEHVLSTVKGKLIVIDNADTILEDIQKIKISMDKDNQYIIFAHSTYGFKPSARSVAKMVVNDNVATLEYTLMRKN